MRAVTNALINPAGNRTMNINSHPPQIPTLNSDVVRPQKSPDSSPESTVIQNRDVAPIADVRVVQQGGESSSGNASPNPTQQKPAGAAATDDAAHSGAEKGRASQAGSELLSEDERREVEQLAQRDREVRAHEQAHLSAAGDRAQGGASFSYTNGPDGKRYATGGEVKIDTSPVRGDPEATLRAAELVQRAALAPAEPSGQDRQVAAEAGAMAQEARAELSQQRAAESQESAAEVADASKAEHEPKGVGVESDGRDDQVKNRQQQLEAIVGTVAQGAVDEPRGSNLDYFL